MLHSEPRFQPEMPRESGRDTEETPMSDLTEAMSSQGRVALLAAIRQPALLFLTAAWPWLTQACPLYFNSTLLILAFGSTLHSKYIFTYVWVTK